MEGNGRIRVADHAEAVAGRFDVDVVPTAPEENDFRQMRRARAARRLFMSLVAVFLLLGLSSMLGVRSRTISVSGGGYQLTVTYGQISRPSLPTPWGFEVRHPGGFDGPITVSTSSKYLELFDENSFDPEPSEMTATADAVIWEFDPPPGDTLAVSLDARIDPAVQWGLSGETSVLDEDGQPVVTARYKTWVLP